MKILYVLNSGNPGGMEKHVLELAVGMQSRKHKVVVMCPSGPVVAWFTRNGIPVILDGMRSDIDILFIRRLARYLRMEKIEVIHAHELKAVVNSLIAAAIVGTEVRVSHTHTPITEWKIGPLKKVFDIALDTFMVNVYGSSEIALTESRKAIKLREGIRESKLAVIPNALDTAGFDITKKQRQEFRKEIRARHGIPKDAFVFGNISRMTPEKGHFVLLRAFGEFDSAFSGKKHNYHLLLAGGGALQSHLEMAAQKLAGSDRVTLTGVFSQEDLVKYYSAFDSFIFPSLAEGFGYVLVEAMYMSLPVICSDLPVLREVGQDTVTFFGKENSTELADEMKTLLKNKKDYREKAVAAKALVEERYTLDAFIDSYEGLYKNLLKEAQKKLKEMKN
jgi:glycosyltransferase involved in cell wall biosynthesis